MRERAIRCRHKDGMVPAGTIRIFLTNHEKLFFFPSGFQMAQHITAIERRMTWVEVDQVLFRNEPIPVLDAVKQKALPQTSGSAATSEGSGNAGSSQSSEARMSNKEVCEADSMPGDSECERELEASLLREQEEEARLLREVYLEPVQTPSATFATFSGVSFQCF